ncbi:MAG: N-acetylmuramoyl-L-alanine amidase [Bacteroidetes bacterium]|nr:N-acetylmuramoyl-L-alanine amidase [Bacteroidota bacterium]
MITRKYTLYILSALLSLFCLSSSIDVSAKKKVRKIVIDAGHGGKDPGCHGVYSFEKDITLAVAKRVGQMVDEHYKDVKVVYTRDSDVLAGGDLLTIKQSLVYRTEVANREKADLFISIHVNATPKRNSPVKGTLVLVCGPTRVDEKENAIGSHTENIDENEGLLDPSDPATQIIIAQYSQAFLTQSIVLGQKINDGFVDQGRVTEGLRQQSLQVLASSAMPGVLVEIGYLNNQDEENYLNSEVGQQEVATTLFNAIKAYKEVAEKETIQIIKEN